MTSYNNSLNIDTSSRAKIGMFGAKLLEYGACRIGKEIWIKNGLTLQDKLVFEAYQEMCEEFMEDVSFKSLHYIEKYEAITSQVHKNKIIETIVEINVWYEIGNEINNP
jgi:hypothetical protein